MRGDLTRGILIAAGFSNAEAVALGRWRARIMPRLPDLADRNLQCWCPLTSPWCHADTLLRIGNRETLR